MNLSHDLPPPAARVYSRAERLSDRAVHWAAIAAATGAVPVLIAAAILWQADAAGIAGVAVYGVTLIAMLAASLLYNHLPRPEWSDMLLRIDHTAIGFKIAGTYTPFALLSGVGAGLLAAIWTAAGLSAAVTFLQRRRATWMSVTISLAMGWAVVVGGWSMLAAMSGPVVALVVSGGVLYSVGTLFLMTRMRFHNTIWHGFVVAASAALFVAVFLHLAQTA